MKLRNVTPMYRWLIRRAASAHHARHGVKLVMFRAYDRDALGVYCVRCLKHRMGALGLITPLEDFCLAVATGLELFTRTVGKPL